MTANIAIVIGDSLHNTYGLIRSLGECGADFYYICLSNTDWDPIERSRYISKGRFLQIKTWEELPTVLDRLKKVPGRKSIICTSDPVATWVDNHEAQLCQSFITPCRGNKIGSLFNKKEQCALATECGLNVPSSLIYSKGDSLDFDKVVYPAFIKPLVSSEGSKADIHICKNAEELKSALANSSHTSSFIIQEYIADGYDLNCIGYRTDHQTAFVCAIRKYRLYPDKFGAGSYLVADRVDGYNINLRGIEKFLERVGYYGPFSVEFVCTDNKNYFMEVNFRNDGLAYAATCAGVNVYESFQNDSYIDTSCLRPSILMNVAFDFSLMRKSRNISFLKWLKEFASADGYLDLSFSDPMPLLWRPVGFLLRRLKVKR